MALKYEAKAKVGTYKNQQGEEKPNWVKLGAVFETSKGLSLKIDAIPVGFDGWVSFFEPKQKENTPTAQSAPANDIPDDIPF